MAKKVNRASKKRVVVLGAGSWGATLAVLLYEKGADVALWEFDRKAAASLASQRRLKILPELYVPPAILVTNDLTNAIYDRTMIVSVTPSHTVRATMKAVKRTGVLHPQSIVVSASKGLEESTLKRMSHVITEELHIPVRRIVALSGPSHAEEVCRHLPTAVVAAGMDPAAVRQVKQAFETEYFRIYPHHDLIGVELGGTLKNIFAIACGISDGLGLGDNSRALLLTRGLNELSRIGVKMGGELLTFFGLAGMGDLIVTCLSRHSRNRSLGEKIGRGKTVKTALAEMVMVAEGMKTAPSAWRLAQKLKLDCPLTREIYEVLYQAKKPKASMKDLMHRQTHSEWQGLPAGRQG